MFPSKSCLQVVRLLTSGDLDAQINSLTFINILLKKCPEKRKKKKLVLILDSVGVLDALEEQKEQIGHADYITQVELFQSLSGEVCSISTFQLESLKRIITKLQLQEEDRRQKLIIFEGEKKYISIIHSELMRYRTAVCVYLNNILYPLTHALGENRIRSWIAHQCQRTYASKFGTS